MLTFQIHHFMIKLFMLHSFKKKTIEQAYNTEKTVTKLHVFNHIDHAASGLQGNGERD